MPAPTQAFELLVALLDDNCPNAFDVSFELFLPAITVIGFNQLAPHFFAHLLQCATPTCHTRIL